MPRRIGLIGGECSGKSALARALARELPACVATEAVRDFVTREGRAPHREEQAAVFAEQCAREAEAATACPHPVLVADPAPLMTAVYSLLYFDDGSLVDAAVDHALGYDLLAWCDPGIPWTPDDGQRDGPQARQAADAIIARLVRERLEPAAIPVLRVVGDLTQRVDLVRRAWLPGAPDSPT